MYKSISTRFKARERFSPSTKLLKVLGKRPYKIFWLIPFPRMRGCTSLDPELPNYSKKKNYSKLENEIHHLRNLYITLCNQVILNKKNLED